MLGGLGSKASCTCYDFEGRPRGIPPTVIRFTNPVLPRIMATWAYGLTPHPFRRSFFSLHSQQILWYILAYLDSCRGAFILRRHGRVRVCPAPRGFSAYAPVESGLKSRAREHRAQAIITCLVPVNCGIPIDAVYIGKPSSTRRTCSAREVAHTSYHCHSVPSHTPYLTFYLDTIYLQAF